ncbi:MAG TPA: SBBP repeat-containing protein [Terriglobia bacterium]|nr:SBBP repeat-containing protein [Terriglobia bacterium]
MSRLPLSFEPNVGQTDRQVKFLTRGPGYNLFLTPDEAVLLLEKPTDLSRAHPALTRERSVLRVELAGANPRVELTGESELPGKSNYFIGNDPRQWHTDVPTYAQVRYRALYQGVDAVYYGRQGDLEYDFVVAPGGDPDQVRFRIVGADAVKVDQDGNLVLTTKQGLVTLRCPQAYQGEGANKRRVAVRYAARSKNEYGFEVASYRRDQALTIDPALLLSSYLGGTGGDVAYGVGVDSTGDVYVAGETNSTDFPTKTAFQASNGGGGDCFVSKLNNTGTQLLYSTYLGGSGADAVAGMAVNTGGAVFITGTTYSSNFPVAPKTTASNPSSPQAFQTTYAGNGDAFVAVIPSSGSALTYASYLGGSGADFGQAITFDSAGNAYVTGSTQSPDFPIPTGTTPFQSTVAGSSDVFVAKVSPSGTELLNSTYLGGAQADTGQGIQVDSSGNVYVAGYTFSTNFPTMNPIQGANKGNADAFATELDSKLSTLQFSTYFGGSDRDRAFGIALDSSANIYITGDTQSTDFPTTTGAPVLQSQYNGNGDAFVVEITNGTTPSTKYSTYLGGTGTDQANGIVIDSSGNAGVVGFTNSSNFPLNDAMQQILGLNGGSGCDTSLCSDVFVADVMPGGVQTVYSTFLGGGGADFGQAIAVDGSGDLYVAGSTSSDNFPALGGAYQGNLGGVAGNAFVAEIEKVDAPAVAFAPQKLNFGSQPVSVTSTTQTVTLVNMGSLPLVINSITPPSSDFTESNNCVGTVAARGGTCTINVTFTPTATGSVTDEFSIDDNAANSPHIITVSGTGVTQATSATVTPTTLVFANTTVGSTTPAQTVTITNTGTSTLDITSISVSGDFTQTNTCASAPLYNTLGPGQSCTASVVFAPTASGSRSGTLSISDNATGSPQGVALSGVGLAQFSLSAKNPTISAIIGTTTVTYSILASSPSNFTGSITLSCPSNLTCSFSPAGVAANSGTASTLTVSNLSISTTNPLNFVVTGTSGSQVSSVNLTLLLSTFTVTASPSVNSVVAGAPAFYTVLVNPIFDFNQQVLLSCTGTLPPGVGCTFASSSVTPNGQAPATVQLKVTTTISNVSVWRWLWPGGKHPPQLLVLLGSVWLLLTLLLMFRARSRRPSAVGYPRIASRAFILATMLVFLTLLGSCRGLTSATSPTPPGPYAITITGTLQSNTDVTSSTSVLLAVGPTT